MSSHILWFWRDCFPVSLPFTFIILVKLVEINVNLCRSNMFGLYFPLHETALRLSNTDSDNYSPTTTSFSLRLARLHVFHTGVRSIKKEYLLTPWAKLITRLYLKIIHITNQFLLCFQASLRQLDLSLLSELWTLSEAMASWRRQLERGPRLRPAPPPPPPPHYLRT